MRTRGRPGVSRFQSLASLRLTNDCAWIGFTPPQDKAVVGLTFGVLFVMLLAYKTGVIRATERFKLGVIAATGGIAVFYLAIMVLGLFHVNIGASVLYGHTWVSIGFSLFVVAIAALNLVLDFDMIETGVRIGAPKYMEWYGAFGLMVTLIWLYLEILRLLANSRRR